MKAIKNIIIYLWSIISHNNLSKIIFYHDISSIVEYTDMATSRAMFERHITTIQHLGFEIVPQITKERKQVMICFDDGFRGIWDNREYFIKNNIKPTIFIAVDLVGKPGYLNEDEIRILSTHGFRFQAHGWSHTNLTKFDDNGLKLELFEAKRRLEEITGADISEICFPQGFYSDRVVALASKSGYKAMYTSDPRPYSKRISECLLPRYLVQYASPTQLKAILRGGMDCLYNHYYKLHKQ